MTALARIDVVLVAQGRARSRTEAAAFIRAGRVVAGGTVVTKASLAVTHDALIEVTPDDDDPGYSSRAGHKLAGALAALRRTPDLSEPTERTGPTGPTGPSGPSGSSEPTGPTGPALPDIAGSICLDIGASTGGFTDVLLRAGARSVHAIDVGHDQLDPRLRADPRVIVSEGVNVRDLTPADVVEPPALIVGDLSFISLRLVIPVLARVAPRAHMLLMVKPQFEVGRERLGRGGVVRDPALHVQAIADVAACAGEVGFETRAVVASSLPGPSGNREFFVLLAPGGAAAPAHALSSAIRAAVADTGGRRAFFAQRANPQHESEGGTR